MEELTNQQKKEFLLGAYFHFMDEKNYEDAIFTAKQYETLFPDEFMGYHIRNLACRYGEKWEEYSDCEELRPWFSHEKDFWIDWITLIEKEEDEEELLAFLETNKEELTRFPDLYYGNKMGALISLERLDEYHQLTSDMCKRFKVRDERLRRLFNFLESNELLAAASYANTILKDEIKTKSVVFYIVLQLQIILLIKITDGNLTEDQEETIKVMSAMWTEWIEKTRG